MSYSPDVTALVGYAGKYRKQLITRLVNGLQVVQDCTLRPNIKIKETMTKLTVGGQVKPYTGIRNTTGSDVKFTPRTIEVFLGQYDLDINTIAARKTWLSEVMKPGVNPTDLPFEQEVWNGVMDNYGTQINDVTAWNGRRNDAGTTTATLATGFGNIIKDEITAGAITPVVTGSMLTDTVDKMEAIYKSLPSKFRKKKMTAYVSYNVFDAYCEDYAERFKMSPLYDKFGQTILRHSEGNAVLKPVTWMADTERVVITPQSNMIVGTDLLSDLTRILTVPQMYHLEAGIVAAIGFQIEDLEPLAVNDAE